MLTDTVQKIKLPKIVKIMLMDTVQKVKLPKNNAH